MKKKLTIALLLATSLFAESKAKKCTGYYMGEIIMAEAECKTDCWSKGGCTIAQYKSCYKKALYKECANRKHYAKQKIQTPREVRVVQTPREVGVTKINGLMWQDEPLTPDEFIAPMYNRNHGKVGNWEHAKGYCSSLTLNGHNDWRLPDYETLKALYENSSQLTNVFTGYYWSSSSYVDISSYAWNVYFFNDKEELLVPVSKYDTRGNNYRFSGKSNSLSVRCVRDSD